MSAQDSSEVPDDLIEVIIEIVVAGRNFGPYLAIINARWMDRGGECPIMSEDSISELAEVARARCGDRPDIGLTVTFTWNMRNAILASVRTGDSEQIFTFAREAEPGLWKVISPNTWRYVRDTSTL